MNTAARIPEGMTDPDEIDRLLEARDAQDAQQAAARMAEDDAVMAAVARNRPNPDAVTKPNQLRGIADRIEYDQRPWWQRWPFRERPPGYVDRRPVYR